MENAGYHMPENQVYEGQMGPQLGNRYLAPYDARLKLDRIYLSEILEEQGPLGPKCFGPGS